MTDSTKDAGDDGDEPRPGSLTATGHSAWPVRFNLPNNWLSELNSVNQTVARAVQPIAQILESREWLGRQVSILAMPGMETLFKDLNKRLVSPSLLESAVASLGAMSHVALGESMITSSLAAKWANLRVGDLLGGLDLSSFDALGAVLAERVVGIPNIARFVEHHNSLLAQLAPSIDVAKSVAFATRAWQDVVRVTPEDEGGRYLTRFDIAGRTTAWAVHAGVLLTEDDDAELEQREAEAVVALGPGAASAELRVCLNQINPALCDKLDGAWERIASGGADSVSQQGEPQSPESVAVSRAWFAASWRSVEAAERPRIDAGRCSRVDRCRRTAFAGAWEPP